MSDLKDFTKQNLLGVYGLTQSPFFQDIAAQQQSDAFRKDLNAYNKRKFNLTDREIDALILAIASGKDTYKDLQVIIPEMNSPTMCDYLLDEPQPGPGQNAKFTLIHEPRSSYFRFKGVPDDFFYLYEFKPTDSFILSILGENRLYELQKEKKSWLLAKQSIASADAAVTWAKISVIVSIVLFVLGRLLG